MIGRFRSYGKILQMTVSDWSASSSSKVCRSVPAVVVPEHAFSVLINSVWAYDLLPSTSTKARC